MPPMTDQPPLSPPGVIEKILIEPYDRFIRRLHREKRISDAELNALESELKERLDKIGNLIFSED